jgi:hypothetical protein
VLVGDAAKVPLAAFVPLHPPEAVHEVALVEDQVTVELLPDVMLVGLAEIVTVAGGILPPPPPHQVPPPPHQVPGNPDGGVVGVVGGVDPPDTDADAEQVAVVPPLEPPQLHVHGPEPATDDAVPAEQRLVEGLDDAVVPFADPHMPLTGAGAVPTATVVLAADAPPAPMQVSV